MPPAVIGAKPFFVMSRFLRLGRFTKMRHRAASRRQLCLGNRTRLRLEETACVRPVPAQAPRNPMHTLPHPASTTAAEHAGKVATYGYDGAGRRMSETT